MELNFTEINNLTIPYDVNPMTFNGMINGTTPITATIQGNITVVTHDPVINQMFNLEIVQTVSIIVITICVIALTIQSIMAGRKLR